MIRRKNEIWQLSNELVTPKPAFLNRRQIMKAAGALGVTALAGCGQGSASARQMPTEGALAARETNWQVSEDLTPYEAVTGYNNFYEFGLDKGDPARYASAMTTSPWNIEVSGLTDEPREYALQDLVDFDALEERVYRLRCVEAWSMVIPWVGVPLASIIERLRPSNDARYVQFETYLNRNEMRGTRLRVLDWPYVEGLRLDEARNELAFLAVGLYGEVLPKQNGAPIRLVVPWKYGYKSIKSIAKIRFTSEEPATSWNQSAPNEYGFYSNVNPNRAHPRWSQSSERIIGGGLLARRETEMFNGYEDQVASMYAGMDLIEQH
ncbi:protein-methionine-sulfoxide reductase catalytic subunit MsrP [Maricaulis sp.]|uniref:protein-methionine-sulfoxide reductase catalytic subunit MsrP n=1 Tax=Maricaulis sp. TaxID=1486257 RepID=UPI001B23D753|nr:protein-methionine-sulfoxide reductase catalytic subunit MsrP [Maricaulis sp.]MBO6797865.1 protein-methionine-sulfoxide reductase catalytic subunit MsrP [Maricaulis sp.]